MYIVFVYFLIVGLVLISSLGSPIQNITFAIAVGALLLSFVSFKSKNNNDNVVEANFEKAIKAFKIEKQDETKRIILEALLKIKAKKPNYKLVSAMKINPEMFAKDKLLEKLYE